MPFGREQFTVTAEVSGELTDRLYAKELIPISMEEFGKHPRGPEETAQALPV